MGGKLLNKNKIINDPVLGFISLPFASLYDIIQHRYVQRLTRIRQLGLSFFVYPGNTHTRFIHSLGAMHLTDEAIRCLKDKGIEISDEEHEATLQAILLHDIGHSPFSHALENVIIKDIEHEEITIRMMRRMNEETNGKLELALKIFNNEYRRTFLHQLISSQLDMDRLDYLVRDSFFSGVREGSIGGERIIKMLNVKNDRIVIDEKGLYSAENFLIARRLMYWQVYLHKTTVATEKMLRQIIERAGGLCTSGKEKLNAASAFKFFLYNNISGDDMKKDERILDTYVLLDDSDILSAIKEWTMCNDQILSYLCTCLINRQLYKVKIGNSQKEMECELEKLRNACINSGIKEEDIHYFCSCDEVKSRTYNPQDDKISIIGKNGEIRDISECSDILNTQMLQQKTSKHYLFYAQKIMASD